MTRSSHSLICTVQPLASSTVYQKRSQPTGHLMHSCLALASGATLQTVCATLSSVRPWKLWTRKKFGVGIQTCSNPGSSLPMAWRTSRSMKRRCSSTNYWPWLRLHRTPSLSLWPALLSGWPACDLTSSPSKAGLNLVCLEWKVKLASDRQQQTKFEN